MSRRAGQLVSGQMKNNSLTFQILIVQIWLLQLLAYFMPTPFIIDVPFEKTLNCFGHGSLLTSLPSSYSLLLDIFQRLVFLVSTIGMFFFKIWGRRLFLIWWIYSCCMTLLIGSRLATPLQGFLGIAMNTLDGAVLALAFLSPLSKEFGVRTP